MPFSVICNREPLVSALATASSITKAKTPKPVLQCVRMVADKSLGVFANNMEQKTGTIIGECQVEESGSVQVNCDRLYAFINEMTDATVSMSVDGTRLLISGDSVRFRLDISADEFPPTAIETTGTQLKIPCQQFARMVETVSACVDSVSKAGSMRGLFIDASEGAINAVCTDGRRLAWQTCGTTDAIISAVVPMDPLRIVAKAAADDQEGDVTIHLDEHSATFGVGFNTLQTTLMEGAFPLYRTIFPAEPPVHQLKVHRESFLAAIRQAALSNDEMSKAARFEFNMVGLTIAAKREGEDVHVNFPCKWATEPLTIGLNSRFLAEMLRPLDSDEIEVFFWAKFQPVIIKSGTWQGILMPINIE